MTKREFYTNVIEGTINEEMIADAQKYIEALDTTNAKRREKMVEKNAEKEAAKAPIREALVACVTDEAKTATTLIAEAGLDVKPQAIPSLLKPFVEAGDIVKTTVKVKGKGAHVGYVRAE